MRISLEVFRLRNKFIRLINISILVAIVLAIIYIKSDEKNVNFLRLIDRVDIITKPKSLKPNACLFILINP